MPVLAGAVRLKADQPPVPGWVAYENGYISDPCPPSGICFDWSSTTYRITHVSADGLLGRWDNPMSGNFKLYDPKTKRVLASPSGYFCAIRRAKDLGAI